MAKLTNAQLNALVAKLDNELTLIHNALKAEGITVYGDHSKGECMLMFGKKPVNELLAQLNKTEQKTEPETKTETTVVKVDESKTVATMRWALKYVGFQSACTDEFLAGFDIWTNKDKNWLAIMPKKGVKTGGFIREFNQARHAKGLTGNYWKNDGAWMNIPVKK